MDSGGRSVILQTSRKMMPTTSEPPLVKAYGFWRRLFLRPLMRRRRLRFSAVSGFVGSSTSSDSSSRSSSSSSSSSVVPSLDEEATAGGSSVAGERTGVREGVSVREEESTAARGMEPMRALNLSKICRGVAALLVVSRRVNCSWTSPET